MEAADNFLALKLETLQIIMSLQDSVKLQRVRAVLEETESTPQVILELIQRGQAESAAGRCRPVEELLEEMEGR